MVVWHLQKRCLNLTDNLERSKLSIINDESLEKNKKIKLLSILILFIKIYYQFLKKSDRRNFCPW